MRYAAPLLCLALLSGCAGNLQRLKDENPSANDFNSALASEYLEYGESEAEQGRQGTGDYYAGKGLRAMKGQAVWPESPDTKLTHDQQQELAASRKLLMSMETDDMKRVAPQKLARAQLLFDCWQHQLSKDLNQEDAPCAEEFKSTISELEDVMDTLVYGKEDTHVLSFSHSSARVSAENKAALAQIAQQAKDAMHYMIELQAHAKPSQRKLAVSRLHAVRNALVEAGVSAKRIEIKNPASTKAVALSHDKALQGSDKVNVTLKTHNPPKIDEDEEENDE